ncbi:GNAT family N-acetyltransferase [Oceanirhabdus sp. W0125-5]|uniref:GNAT family N-acetyltransferase n=1 Tax=Oceanirhabdus sp. W0125-5 TaxID=2999116 RepID=UPI0022F2E4AE|nr:GNAT family N-acetyltransferase [Oceanirhabdus sp. W0125-5]WBW97026.1 GNAT family N-acetyltransferase [Oceanirhabdus sp. W0125-5]
MDIKTERLILREFNDKDYKFFKKLEQNEFYIKYERDSIPTEEETREKFEGILEKNNSKDNYRFLITRAEDGEPLGTVLVWCIDKPIREWEIGWGLSQEHTGKGIATEAARALLKFGFDKLNAHRIQANCNANNIASEKIMERIGMKKEGTLRDTRILRGEWFGSTIYSILENEI